MAQGIERPGFVSQPDFHVIDFIVAGVVREGGVIGRLGSFVRFRFLG